MDGGCWGHPCRPARSGLNAGGYAKLSFPRGNGLRVGCRLRAELLRHRCERTLSDVERLLDIALGMRRRDEPVVHRMKVHTGARARAAKYSRPIVVTIVRLETHVRQRWRSRIRNFKSRAMRLREQSGPQLFAYRAHPLDTTARLQLLQGREARSHRHRAGEV